MKRLPVLLCLLILAAPLWAAVTAHLDRERIADGETVQLQIEADGQVQGRPDTTPLRKDFDILGSSSGSRVSIVNGRMDARTTWTLTLGPRHTGRLRIPPLRVGGEQTPALSLEVGRAPVPDASSDSPVFIETSVRPPDPYVQGMVLYTVRVFRRVRLGDGKLGDPDLDQALVRRLGRDREYSVQRGGRRYRVVERRYAIFPQADGELRIPGPVLDVQVPDPSARARDPLGGMFNDPFFKTPLDDLFTPMRHMRIRGPARTLKVRPVPPGWKPDRWLPALDVRLSQQWRPKDGPMHVGDAIVRTIELRATGLTGEQLPDPLPGAAEGFKVYPDKPQAQTHEQAEGVQGRKILRITYIPTRPGRLNLPPLKLRWWDVRTGQAREAALPGRALEVLASPGASASPSAPAAARAAAPVRDRTPVARPDERGPSGDRAADRQSRLWPWISLAFALAWLATLWRLWHRRRVPDAMPAPKPAPPTPARPPVETLRRRFVEAAEAGRPVEARHALLEWAAAHWPEDPPRGLEALGARLTDPEARQALARLDEVIYREPGAAWDGRQLARLLRELPRPRDDTGDDPSRLPGLYHGQPSG